MNKPKTYENIQIGWEPVAPGGHKCVIKKVEETKSKNGLDMLVINFDMHQTDTQPNYFANQYIADQKANRNPLKWRGVSYWVVDDNVEYGTKNLKAFNTAITDSNEGFEIVWGDGYAKALEGKLVGIVFREEEYTKEDHTVGYATKPMRYCDFNKAFDQAIPKRKEAPAPQGPAVPGNWANAPVNSSGNYQPQQQSWSEGFVNVSDSLDDDGLPWR